MYGRKKLLSILRNVIAGVLILLGTALDGCLIYSGSDVSGADSSYAYAVGLKRYIIALKKV
jgi:hypothetical protein